MKRVWIIVALLGMISMVHPYVSSSFRYSSTAGLYLDDYDWIATDPGYIPYIEGNRLYTNLSNFINQKENVFGNLGVGYYLLGLKYSHLGLILDDNFSKISDSTGLDNFLGHGEKSDTTYPDTNKTSITYESRDAWHESKVADFMLGWGFLLGENKSLGISYTYDYSLLNSVKPKDNSLTFEREDSATTITKLDSTIITGSEKTALSHHRALFSFWNRGEEWDMNLKLGLAYTMDNSYKREKHSFRKKGTEEVSASDTLETSPYSGFRIPLDILAIHHLGEESELWFNIGVAYTTKTPTTEAGKSEMEEDTVFGEEGDSITVDSYKDAITGRFSSFSGHLFTKGTFPLSDRLSLGMGLRFGGLTSTDSSHIRTTASSLSQTPTGSTRSDTTYSSWTKTKTTQFTLALPVAVEFYLTEPLILRLGATYIHTLSDTAVEERSSSSYSKGERRETKDNTLYSFGLGYKVTDNLQIDLMGFSHLLDLTQWKLSLTLKF